MQLRNDQEHEDKQAVVKRPNPEATARVEILEVGFGLLGFQQDSGDQEPGKHKKQLYTIHPYVDIASRCSEGNASVL